MRHSVLEACNSILRFGAGILLVGCAASADPAHMIPSDAIAMRSHTSTVDIGVTGGRNTNPMWTSQVSSEDFRKALEESLLRYGVFSRVIQNTSANYRLSVALLDLKQPLVGFNMTVTAHVEWTLTDNQSRRVLWHQITDTPYTARVGDAFYGVHRLELANEGAIREAIKTGIQQMSELRYP